MKKKLAKLANGPQTLDFIGFVGGQKFFKVGQLAKKNGQISAKNQIFS